MDILTLVFTSVMMGIVQISIFKSFPPKIKYMLAYWTFMAVVVNFLCSGVILIFTGAGNAVGMANMFGSIGFGLWLLYYKSYHKLCVKYKSVLFMKLPYVDANMREETWYI